jgi:transcriptional regulator with XRE-family HTH domain
MNPEYVSVHIGQRLAQRRSELKLSLADVSVRCGVSLQQVHRYEIGQNAISAPMLWHLSRCLEAPITYFFDGLDAEGEIQADRCSSSSMR